MFTGFPDVTDDPELAAATGLMTQVFAERYFEYLMRWLEAKPGESPQWQQAAHFGDTMLYITAEELVELAEQEQALMDRFLDRLTQPELRPPGARAVTYLHLAFPGDISGARQPGSPHQGPEQ
jgi:hypothetical protein